MRKQLLLSAALLSFGLPAQAAVHVPDVYSQGVVAADHVLASEAGVKMLRQGGNAFDAAIATSLMLGVVRPYSTGIGGGGFMLYQTAKGQQRILDYREVAPGKAHAKMFLDSQGQPLPELSTQGYLAVAVPGVIAGLEQISKEHGKLPFKALFQPAIEAAEKGFPVDHNFVRTSELMAERPLRPELKALYFNQGKPRKLGELQRNPELAQTLRLVAEQGAAAFYKGPIAQKIVTAMQAQGGLINAQDLASYQPRERQPLRGSYRGYEILTMPPPSSGGTALLTVLNLLEPYQLGWNSSGFGSSQYLHLLTESMKHAFSDRANFLGDPDYVKVPLQTLVSKAHSQRLQPLLQQASQQTLSREQYGLAGLQLRDQQLQGLPDDHGTTHYAVMDKFGNVVSATETINTYFGSQVVVPGTGMVMNNEMDDFSIAPGVPNAFGLIGNAANAIAPGKKPLSSMTPTIVLRQGKPYFAVGASGGPRIITGTLQTLINVIDFGMNATDAVSAARVHHQWVPDTLFVEFDMPLDVQRNLQAKGHQLAVGVAENNVQLVIRKDGQFTAASDPRKGGHPAGY